MMEVKNQSVIAWVEEKARLTKPDRIVWIDGSEQEHKRLLAEAVKTGELLELNPEKHPGCHFHRTHPNDVARTEHCTYICTPSKDDAGPTNNWMSPDEAYAKLHQLFDGVMRGRTMYVIPYLMGPKGSSFSKVGIELTDSIYVVANMRIMTRMGSIAIEHLGDSSDFVKGLHSRGTIDADNRYICHFPQDSTIYSINSGYGGNVLLSKKCFALRIASWLGKKEGWLAEHMLIMGVEAPDGRVSYIAGAFPSACGKTNLAMLRPSGKYKGYKIWCVGDDIAWMRVGKDGRLYAMNPEAGFFGVAPGTNYKTNPNMMSTISRDTIFTNVAISPDKTLWWEGLDMPADAEKMLDWQGKPWDPKSGQKAAHPNSRFTVSIKQCPLYTPKWDDPQGVPISAILFGSRRASLMPLVFEAFNWQHGVFLGATLASETTAAAMGAAGVLRYDPMAMLPFCGYNMADYMSHWLSIGKRLSNPPRIFRVNWFRTNKEGKFIWPGFGDNMRVIKWVVDRCEDKADAQKTPIGYVPNTGSLDVDGLSLSNEDLEEILSIDVDGWLESAKGQEEFFLKFGNRFPSELLKENKDLISQLQAWKKQNPVLSSKAR